MTTKPEQSKRTVRLPNQRSVTDQLETLRQIANKEGLYDAADFLRTWLETRVSK